MKTQHITRREFLRFAAGTTLVSTLGSGNGGEAHADAAARAVLRNILAGYPTIIGPDDLDRFLASARAEFPGSVRRAGPSAFMEQGSGHALQRPEQPESNPGQR